MSERVKKFRDELRGVLCADTSDEAYCHRCKRAVAIEFPNAPADNLRIAAGLSKTPHPSEVDAALDEIFGVSR